MATPPKDVLVDADALVALAKNNDTNHVRAVNINRQLQKRGATFYLSPFTIGEAVTVISYKVSHQAAGKLLREMRKLDLPELVLSEKASDLADKWFLKQKKKGNSYFDCYNMALLERYKNQVAAIFSFDKVYARNGFKLAGEVTSE